MKITVLRSLSSVAIALGLVAASGGTAMAYFSDIAALRQVSISRDGSDRLAQFPGGDRRPQRSDRSSREDSDDWEDRREALDDRREDFEDEHEDRREDFEDEIEDCRDEDDADDRAECLEDLRDEREGRSDRD
ncbi:MAG: hypothetical protein AAGJ95_18225, partial [Cyanobacteria bacterium J06554_11]